jgi:hypothetical protein
VRKGKGEAVRKGRKREEGEGGVYKQPTSYQQLPKEKLYDNKRAFDVGKCLLSKLSFISLDFIGFFMLAFAYIIFLSRKVF